MSKIKDIVSALIKGNNLFGHVSEYIELRIELLKIDIREEIIWIILQGFLYALVFLFVSLFLLFLSIGGALYINTFYTHSYLGYWVVSGFYLVLFIGVLIFRKSIFKKNSKVLRK